MFNCLSSSHSIISSLHRWSHLLCCISWGHGSDFLYLCTSHLNITRVIIYCLSTHRFLVIAVILLVTVAHASVTPRPPHFLENVFVLKIFAKYYSANLGSWLMARGEGWAHQRFSPPARGLVLKIVIIWKSSLSNGFGNNQSESLPSPLQLCSTRVSSTCSTLPHFSTLLNFYLQALIMAGL